MLFVHLDELLPDDLVESFTHSSVTSEGVMHEGEGRNGFTHCGVYREHEMRGVEGVNEVWGDAIHRSSLQNLRFIVDSDLGLYPYALIVQKQPHASRLLS